MMMKKQKYRWIMSIVFIVIVIVTSACASYKQEIGKNNGASSTPESAAKPKSAAVDFRLEGLNKEILDSAELDKPVLMVYWATWCSFCREEMAELESVYEEYAGRVTFAAVNLTHLDSIRNIEQYVSKHEVSIPVYLDPKGEATGLFRVLSTPTRIALDRQGQEVNRKVGVGGKNNVDTLKSILDELLSHDS